MQFRPKFGMSKKEHLRQSDIFVNAQCHLETRNPGQNLVCGHLRHIFVIAQRHLLCDSIYPFSCSWEGEY